MTKVLTVKDDEKELKAFLDGYKPAILPFNKSSIIYTTLTTTNFFYCSSTWKNLPMFFRNKADAVEYIKNQMISDVNPHLVNGYALGYPPLAVSEFVKRLDEGYDNRAYVNYYGIYFATFTDILEENMTWLQETYKLNSSYGDILVQTFSPNVINKYTLDETGKIMDIIIYNP